MRSKPGYVYRLLHKDYPEIFSAYAPQPEFYNFVHSQIPDGWDIHRQGIWFYCCNHQHAVPRQGWKIHISATPENAKAILEKVAAILFRHAHSSFKFAVDRSVLCLLNSKSWSRGGSGKFITIYPADQRAFLELIEDLHQATCDLCGPYILSDQRYKNSKVVYYRFGSMQNCTTLNIKGEKIPVVAGPDGSLVPDQRLPFPVVPSWAERPFKDGGEPMHNRPGLLRNGRYEIVAALSFSNAGGVYKAIDTQSGEKVVIKEARPWVNSSGDGYDAVDLLKKEHRLLAAVADAGIAPRPIDLFPEWEHWFLVEEFIEGIPMGNHSAIHSILLRTRASARECNEWVAMFAKLCSKLIGIIRQLHSRNIVFADLSPSNLIVTPSGELKIIDFEGAYQPRVDHASNLYTPGFVSKRRISGAEASAEDDYYSAGAVLLGYLLPINDALHLDPQLRQRFIGSIRKDMVLPEVIIGLIERLLDGSEHFSSLPDSPIEVHHPAAPIMSKPAGVPACDYEDLIEDIARHLNGAAAYERTDRLYPADPRVFSTNPLSLAYGAAGVAYAINKITGNVPNAAIDWILKHRITAEDYPPGLYVGISGIAWALLELGMAAEAENTFQLTFNHPLLHESPDLFHGIAGWGMTALRFFQATGKAIYLDRAREAGKRLVATCHKSEQGHSWSASGTRPLGLAHGSSGISLFLLYLYLASRDEGFLRTGVQALEFDLNFGRTTKDGGFSWSETAESSSPLYPYWRVGSAGIGVTTVRYLRLTGVPRYRSILEKIYIDTDRRYAVFHGRFTGLAGMGEFLLDLHELTGEQRFLKSAEKAAEGIMNFRVARNGTAFPGELLSRLCCDFGTGSAGTALFLNRLMARQQNDFMLDGLFEAPAQSSEPGAILLQGRARAAVA